MKTEFVSPFYTQPSKRCKTDRVFIDPIPCIYLEEVVEDEEHLEVQVENQAEVINVATLEKKIDDMKALLMEKEEVIRQKDEELELLRARVGELESQYQIKDVWFLLGPPYEDS